MELRNIYKGWTRALKLVDTPERDKEIARERVQTCLSCPHVKEQWLSKFVEGVFVKDIENSGLGCDLCGCPINEAALAPDKKCPDGRWKR